MSKLNCWAVWASPGPWSMVNSPWHSTLFSCQVLKQVKRAHAMDHGLWTIDSPTV